MTPFTQFAKAQVLLHQLSLVHKIEEHDKRGEKTIKLLELLKRNPNLTTAEISAHFKMRTCNLVNRNLRNGLIERTNEQPYRYFLAEK